MRVSFDLDNTAWKFRTLFRELAWGLKNRGHDVGIPTAHSDSIREADLRLWTARGFPPADFLLNATDRDRAGVPNSAGWKTVLASKYGIDAHIDDFDSGPDGPIILWCSMPSESDN